MPPTQIRVALDWTPNTIHTGLFVAQARGYYARHGVSVSLLLPDAAYTRTPAKQLAAGVAELAICPSESCIAYNEAAHNAGSSNTRGGGGQPLKLQAIYAILQRDASAIACNALAVQQQLRPRELSDRKLTYGSYNARYEDAIVAAMVRADGGNPEEVRVVRDEGKLGLFAAVRANRVNATWIFAPWEGVEAEMDAEEEERGEGGGGGDGTGRIVQFRLEDYGIPYGYSPVIAREAGEHGLAEGPLRAFVEATREGYEYAVTHAKEAVEILEKHCVPPRSKEFLLRSQETINGFYGDGSEKLGSMDAEKWATWLKWLADQGLLEGKVNAEDIFDTRFAA